MKGALTILAVVVLSTVNTAPTNIKDIFVRLRQSAQKVGEGNNTTDLDSGKTVTKPDELENDSENSKRLFVYPGFSGAPVQTYGTFQQFQGISGRAPGYATVQPSGIVNPGLAPTGFQATQVINNPFGPQSVVPGTQPQTFANPFQQPGVGVAQQLVTGRPVVPPVVNGVPIQQSFPTGSPTQQVLSGVQIPQFFQNGRPVTQQFTRPTVQPIVTGRFPFIGPNGAQYAQSTLNGRPTFPPFTQQPFPGQQPNFNSGTFYTPVQQTQLQSGFAQQPNFLATTQPQQRPTTINFPGTTQLQQTPTNINIPGIAQPQQPSTTIPGSTSTQPPTNPGTGIIPIGQPTQLSSLTTFIDQNGVTRYSNPDGSSYYFQDDVRYDTDASGVTTFVDANGVTRYLNLDGSTYYFQNGIRYDTNINGVTTFVDQNGVTRYLNSDGSTYYFQNGVRYDTDINGVTTFVDQNGVTRYLNSDGSTYYFQNGVGYDTNVNGVTTFVDQNGVSRYLNSDGSTYYFQNGVRYDTDVNGVTSFTNSQDGETYYLDSNGAAYKLGPNGEHYYANGDGTFYYIDSNGIKNTVYPDGTESYVIDGTTIYKNPQDGSFYTYDDKKNIYGYTSDNTQYIIKASDNCRYGYDSTGATYLTVNNSAGTCAATFTP